MKETAKDAGTVSGNYQVTGSTNLVDPVTGKPLVTSINLEFGNATYNPNRLYIGDWGDTVNIRYVEQVVIVEAMWVGNDKDGRPIYEVPEVKIKELFDILGPAIANIGIDLDGMHIKIEEIAWALTLNEEEREKFMLEKLLELEELDKEDDPLDKEEEGDGKRFWGTFKEYNYFVDLEGSGKLKLTGNDGSYEYDPYTAIPTSTYLEGNVSEVQQQLWDIKEREWSAYAWAQDIKINSQVFCYYECPGCDVYEKEEWYDEKESKWKEEWIYVRTDWHGSYYHTAPGEVYKGFAPSTKEETYSQKTWHDVPISNIYNVINSTITGTPTKSERLLITLQGANKALAQTHTVKSKKPGIGDEVLATAGPGEYPVFSTVSEAKKAATGYAKDQRLREIGVGIIKNSCSMAVQNSVSHYGVNYDYSELHVETTYHSGTPQAKYVEGNNKEEILSNKPNGDYPIIGAVEYEGGYNYALNEDVRPVLVHTPVVNNTTITTGAFINQKINKESGVNYVILDGTFTVSIQDKGTHRGALGYGTRLFNSFQGINKLQTTWGKQYDVYMPFDAYLHNGGSKTFIPANTWISTITNMTGSSYTFTIPVWAEEGKHKIKTKVIAENALQEWQKNMEEPRANKEQRNYAATDEVEVEIVGKIYDLRISQITDPGWTIKAPGYLTSKEFPLGQTGQNANTKYNYAPKLGYTFVFDFKTKGTKSNNIEVSLVPNGFYFIGRNGENLQEVDLYYHTATDKFIKIGGAKDNINLQVNLREAWMGVSTQELIDSTRIRGSRINYGITRNIGRFSKMTLPEELRLCYNNFLEYATDITGGIIKLYGRTQGQIAIDAGTRDRVIESVGHWYAGYRLPASTRALPKGTDITKIVGLNNNSKEFLTNGYILVRFDIKTKYNQWPYLQYTGPEGLNEGKPTGTLEEEWTKIPSPNPLPLNNLKEITLPGGRPAKVPKGTIAIYDASLRSSNDVETSGTH